jgi:hypothetical protein
MPDGNGVALIYSKDLPDVVLSWDDGALPSAGDSAEARFINPKQRAMTNNDWLDLKLGNKNDYLVKLAAVRAKHALQKRYVLWPSGSARSEWNVYENDDGSYIADGEFSVWFEDGKPNEKGSYKNGKPDGHIQEWDINGGIITDGAWIDGVPSEGLCRDLSDGRKVKRFKDGKVVVDTK